MFVTTFPRDIDYIFCVSWLYTYCLCVFVCVFSQYIVWIVRRQQCVVLVTLGCDGGDSVWSIAVVL